MILVMFSQYSPRQNTLESHPQTQSGPEKRKKVSLRDMSVKCGVQNQGRIKKETRTQKEKKRSILSADYNYDSDAV